LEYGITGEVGSFVSSFFHVFKGLLNGEELSMFIPVLLKKILVGYLLARLPVRSLFKHLLYALFFRKYSPYASVVLIKPKSVWSAK